MMKYLGQQDKVVPQSPEKHQHFYCKDQEDRDDFTFCLKPMVNEAAESDQEADIPVKSVINDLLKED